MLQTRNQIDIRDDYAVILIDSPKYGRVETKVSIEDIELLDRYDIKWYACRDEKMGSFYILGNEKQSDGSWKKVRLHRLLLDAPSHMLVDHINHDTLDNRRGNLYVCGSLENNQNVKEDRANNASGARGVSWYNKLGKWRVQVQSENKKKHIGYFESKDAAIKASIEARSRFHIREVAS